MMLSRFSLIGVLCLALALAVPAIAQESGSDMGAQGGAAAEPGMEQGAGGAAPGEQAPSAEQPPAAGAEGQQAEMKEVEGKISSLDPQNKTMKVGGLAGLFGTELHVTDQTRFVPGPGVPSADFSALKEGDRIRASYQKVGDRNVANEVVVLTPSEQPPAGAGAGAGAPPSEGAGGMESQPPAGQEGMGGSQSGY